MADRPGKALRVFLSSTSDDLVEYRNRVAEAIASLSQSVVRMESFGARPQAPLAECQRLAAEADVLVVLVAHRYGWIPSAAQGGDDKTSVTWHEVNAARQSHKPVFAFLVDPTFHWTGGTEQDRLREASQDQLESIWIAVQQLKAFKTFLQDSVIVASFTNPDDLKSKVATSLGGWLLREQQQESVAEPTGGSQRLINFLVERQQHDPFVGRADLFARLDAALVPSDRTAGAWVLVIGTPGTGKSAIIANYWKHLEQHSMNVAVHFLRRQISDWAQPEIAVRSLYAQVATLFYDQAVAREEGVNGLLDLLTRVSAKRLVPEGRRLYLLVDGLDEAGAAAQPGQNPLPLFLPYTLPERVFVVCASRPTYDHLSWLQSRRNLVTIDLNDADWSESNLDACREFWESQTFDPPLGDAFIAEAVARAAGNMLHAITLSDWLRQQPPHRRRVDIIPRGLAAIQDLIWRDLRALGQADFAIVRNGLGLLCASRDALPGSALMTLLDENNDSVFETFLKSTRPFLLEQQSDLPGSEASYRLFHESFREFLIQRLGNDTVVRHHGRLAETVAAWPPPDDASSFTRRYASLHALTHRFEARDWSGAAALATRIDYLEAMCRWAGASYLQTALAVHALRFEAGSGGIGSDPEREARRRVRDALRLVRREAHRLSAWDAEARAAYFAQQILYRASCTGLHALREAAERRLRELDCGYVRLRWQASRESPNLLQIIDSDSGLRAGFGTADGTRAVVATAETLRVITLDAGETLQTLEVVKEATADESPTQTDQTAADALDDEGPLADDDEQPESITAIAVHPHRALVAYGTTRGEIAVWDWQRNAVIWQIHGHDQPVGAMCFASDGDLLVSGSSTTGFWDMDDWQSDQPSGGTVLRSWDASSGTAVCEFTAHTEGITAIVPAADGDVVSASWNESGNGTTGTVRQWNPQTGKESRTYATETRVGFLAVGASASQRLIIARTSAGTLELWNSDNGVHVRSILLGGSEDDTTWEVVRSPIVLSSDGRRVLAVVGNVIRSVDLATGADVDRLVGHQEGLSIEGTIHIRSLSVLRDGARLLSSSSDGRLLIWDLETPLRESTSVAHEKRVKTVAFSADGAVAISASEDLHFKRWDALTGHQQSEVSHGSSIDAVAIAMNERPMALTAADDLRFWDLDTGNELAAIPSEGLRTYFDSSWGRGGGVNALAVSTDAARWAYVHYPDGLTDLVVIRDSTAAVMRQSYIVTGPLFEDVAVPTVAFTRDLTRMAITTAPGRITVRPLDEAAAENIDLLDESEILALAFDDTGERLAVATARGSISLIDLASRDIRMTTSSGDRRVMWLAFTPDGGQLVAEQREYAFERWRGPLEVRAWDATSGEARSHFVDARILPSEGRAHVRHAIRRADDATFKVIDVASDREVGLVPNLSAESVVVAASQDGRFAVTRDSDRRSLTVWDLQTGILRHTIDHHGSRLTALCAAEPSVLMVGWDDGTILDWDLERGLAQGIHQTHAGAVAALTVNADGSVSSADNDGHVITWQRHDGSVIASADLDGPIVWLRTASSVLAAVLRPIDLDQKIEQALTMDEPRRGSKIVLRVFDRDFGLTFRSTSEYMRAVPLVAAFSAGGRYVLWPQIDGVRVTDPETRTERDIVTGGHADRATLTALAVSTANRVWIGLSNGTLEERPLDMEQESRTLGDESDATILTIAHSPDGGIAMTGDRFGHVAVWDAQARLEIAFVGLEASVECAAFAPDGRTCLVGDRLGSIYCLEYVPPSA